MISLIRPEVKGEVKIGGSKIAHLPRRQIAGYGTLPISAHLNSLTRPI